MNTTNNPADAALRAAEAAKREAADKAKVADDKARQAIEDAKHPDSVHRTEAGAGTATMTTASMTTASMQPVRDIDAPPQATVHGGQMSTPVSQAEFEASLAVQRAMSASVHGGIGATAAERAGDVRMRGEDRRPVAQRLAEMRAGLSPEEQAEMDRELAKQPAAVTTGETSDPVVFDIGDTAVVALGFVDDYDDDLGPQRAVGPGSATSSDASICTVAVAVKNDQVEMTITGVNPGKSTIVYRVGEQDLTVPVEVVRREPKSIVVRDVNRQSLQAPVV